MPRPTINKIGKRFGMLLVVRKLYGKGRTQWHCLCDCGQEKDVRDDYLGTKTNSCGCMARDNWKYSIPFVTKHGHCKDKKLTREYVTWRGMWQRCYDPNVRNWKHYGGRGIKVCPHWKHNFSQFFADMGNKPKSMTIERIDNENGYLCFRCLPPDGNCRWASYSDQLKNQRHRVFHHKRSRRTTKWWMEQTKEYRHERAVAAARARWGW